MKYNKMELVELNINYIESIKENKELSKIKYTDDRLNYLAVRITKQTE